MANPPPEAARAGREDAKAPDTGDAAASTAVPASGGFKAWLPLIVAVVTMPALAYATTKLVLLPKLERSVTPGGTGASGGAATESLGATGKDGEKPGTGKTKTTVPLSKMLVNVSGTMGTRYLMTSVTLVSNTPDFKSKIDDNKDQLMDLATGTLSSKTIADLEKPGARNVIRAELMTVFNNAL